MASNRNMPKPGAASVQPAAPKVEEEQAAPKVEEEQAAPQKKSNKIEVVALRNGYHRKQRRRKDEKFFVDSEKELGAWMKCTDKTLELKHSKRMKELGRPR